MKKIILLIMFSLTFCQTGFLTERGESRFGFFSSINKNIEHAFYDPLGEFSFSYMASFPLEFGISHIQNKDDWFENKLNITYHFKGRSSNINSFIKYSTGKKKYKYNIIVIEPEYSSHFSAGFYTGKNFYFSVTHGVYETEGLGNLSDNEKARETFFSLGKFFKVNSFVVGINYTAYKELEEEGYLGLILGFVF